MQHVVQQQLVHFLSDMYSVELQALAQLVSAPKLAGDEKIAACFRTHYKETEHHAELIKERLVKQGGNPSSFKDGIMQVGGKGFLFFAQLQSETPGRLIDHAYSYEAMEWAGYEMLLLFAKQVDDEKTVEAATFIGSQERAMMQTLKDHFDRAEAICHQDLSREKLTEHLKKHLADIHAFESQAIHLLKKSEQIGGDPRLNEIYQHQLSQTHKHAQTIEKIMKNLNFHSSLFKDGLLSLAGVSWGEFFRYQSDTPAKLIAFVYALLHLEMGGYELLRRTVLRYGDSALTTQCDEILSEKHQMVELLVNSFDIAATATLNLLYRH